MGVRCLVEPCSIRVHSKGLSPTSLKSSSSPSCPGRLSSSLNGRLPKMGSALVSIRRILGRYSDLRRPSERSGVRSRLMHAARRACATVRFAINCSGFAPSMGWAKRSRQAGRSSRTSRASTFPNSSAAHSEPCVSSPSSPCGCFRSRLTRRLSPSNIEPKEGFALLRKVWASPLEATGLGYCEYSIVMRLEGESEPLAEKVSMLRSLCGRHALESWDDETFCGMGSARAFVNTSEDLWRLSIPPSQAAEVVDRIAAAIWIGDCAGAVLWLSANDHHLVRDVAKKVAGHATLVKADAAKRSSVGVFEAEEEARADLTRSVKAAFDPMGIFNPGRMWDGV